ncbi:MAG: hypothetical protein QOG56_1620 [Solirubrobacteraceae bacterium]|jgi:hypothetical protein|nr:hypothetical protein [Solirubrobacteraceae bacterium]
MDLGRHLHEFWRLRRGAVICLLVAGYAALSMSYEISVFPPGLAPRSLQMASASTQVLVDTPRSTVIDLRQDLFDIESMTNRAVLLGNVMASEPVLAYIARRAGIAPGAIRASTPRTPNSPRPFAAPGQEARTSDLLRSTNQYRLSIEADPTVPVLKIYAQAPTARASAALANAAADGLRDYVEQIAGSQRVAKRMQVRIEQLGRARGAVINDGVRWQVALLTFLGALAASAATGVFLARVRRGWKLAQAEEAHAGGPPGDDARAGGAGAAPAGWPAQEEGPPDRPNAGESRRSPAAIRRRGRRRPIPVARSDHEAG